MRLNITFFIILFLVFSFFITLNLFFERSFQKEALDLSHKEIGLITQNLSEKLALLLNMVPHRYSNWKKFLEENELRREESVYKLFSLFLKDMSSLSGFNIDYQILRSSEIKDKERDLKVEVDLKQKKIYYLLPIKAYNEFLYLRVGISLAEIFEKHLKSVRLTERGYAWIISKDGILLYHPTQPEMVGNNIFGDINPCLKCHKNFEAEKAILKDKIRTGYQYYYSPERKDEIIYYSKLPVYNQEWVLCVSIPYNEILASLNKSMKLHSFIVISIFLAMVIIGALFYYINSKRIAAEEKLKFYNFIYCIIESTQSKLVVIDRNFKILLANSAYAKFVGIPKEKIIGQYFFDICPQKIQSYKMTLRALLEEAFKGNYKELIGYPIEEDNKIKYYHLTINPLKEEGQIIGAVLICDDISEEIYLREELKKYTEELEKLVEKRTTELKAEKEKLSIIMEKVNIGITLVDEKGNILWMNPKMEEILSMCLNNFREVNNICEIFEKSFDCLDSYKPIQFLHEKVCDNQRRVFQVQFTPILHQDSEAKYICLIQDITDLKLMEERIMQSEKLQALARISAGLAHEIGNPLTSISSYVQVLKEMDLGEFANQSLEVISKHILRISEIIRNISSFAKPSKGEVIPTDVNEVLESSLNLVKFDKRMRDIRISLNLGSMPRVLVDPNQLFQVFINIILNACDAMPNGGDLIIETREANHYVEISFTDKGIGIPPENLPHIFDPFFTTKDKGTGLGLAVSYSIVKNFGGEILVSSEVGKGSTFMVRLPAYTEGGK